MEAALVLAIALAMLRRRGATHLRGAIFLSAAGLNSRGLALWLGALLGLAIAVGFGALFARGALRIPLKPFFSFTSAVLLLVALRLFVGGLHELSEAQVLPSSRAEMALIGPIVRSELLLFAFTVGLAAAWLAFAKRPAAAPAEAAASGPDARRARAERARDDARRR